MIYVTPSKAMEPSGGSNPVTSMSPSVNRNSSTSNKVTGKRILTSSRHRLRMSKISSEALENACILTDQPLNTTSTNLDTANGHESTFYKTIDSSPEQFQKVENALSFALSSRMSVSTRSGELMEQDGTVTDFEWVSSPEAMDPNADPASLLDLALEGTLPPAIVRKKSGETLRPALRKSRSEGRALSMSAVSGASRRVHFGPCLEDVRYFFRLDMPSSVSSDCSPAGSDGESDDEDVTAGGSSASVPFGAMTSPLVWKLQLPNFPRNVPDQRPVPVRLERLTLSADGSTLIGVVNVLNYSFHKTVVARFTFDFWTTVSEVTAEYSHGLPSRKAAYGNDKFKFKINLSDVTNLEDRTMYLCIRYVVDGKEHWDNNASQNYQATFIMEERQPVRISCRSKAHLVTPPQKAVVLSPHWPILAFDDFSLTYGNYQQHHELEDSGDDTSEDERLYVRPGRNRPRHQYTPTRNLSHRYDLGASLTAALFTKTTGTSTASDEPHEQPQTTQPGLKQLTTNVASNTDYMKTMPLLGH